jgi:hypothetical protein
MMRSFLAFSGSAAWSAAGVPLTLAGSWNSQPVEASLGGGQPLASEGRLLPVSALLFPLPADLHTATAK